MIKSTNSFTPADLVRQIEQVYEDTERAVRQIRCDPNGFNSTLFEQAKLERLLPLAQILGILVLPENRVPIEGLIAASVDAQDKALENTDGSTGRPAWAALVRGEKTTQAPKGNISPGRDDNVMLLHGPLTAAITAITGAQTVGAVRRLLDAVDNQPRPRPVPSV